MYKYTYIQINMFKKKFEYAKIWTIFTLVEFRSSSHSPGVLSAFWVFVSLSSEVQYSRYSC